MATFNALAVVMKNDVPFLVQQAREEADNARLEMERARMRTEDHAGHMRRWDAAAERADNKLTDAHSHIIHELIYSESVPNLAPAISRMMRAQELLEFGSRSPVQVHHDFFG